VSGTRLVSAGATAGPTIARRCDTLNTSNDGGLFREIPPPSFLAGWAIFRLLPSRSGSHLLFELDGEVVKNLLVAGILDGHNDRDVLALDIAWDIPGDPPCG
jgi:hypothetical protein